MWLPTRELSTCGEGSFLDLVTGVDHEFAEDGYPGGCWSPPGWIHDAHEVVQQHARCVHNQRANFVRYCMTVRYLAELRYSMRGHRKRITTGSTKLVNPRMQG
jgi:hypothetical protein